MANRALTTAMKNELVAKTNRPILIYEGIFVGFTLRLWSGVGDLTWGDNVFLGNGWFQGYEGIEEDNDLGSNV